MPYIYSFGDYEIETDEELDPPQLESLVGMAQGKPFVSSELQKQVDRFNTKPPSFKPGPVQNPFERNREKAGYSSQIVPAAMRVGGNLLGRLGGGIAGGALAGAAATPETGGLGTIPAAGAGAFWGQEAGGVLGSALGEFGAQSTEQLMGTRGSYDPLSIGMEGAFGAIPGSKSASAFSRIGKNALSGAGQATLGAGAKVMSDEGRLPGFSDLAIPALTGAAVSAGGTGLGIRSERNAAADLLGKQKLYGDATAAAQERLGRINTETQDVTRRARDEVTQERLKVTGQNEMNAEIMRVRHERMQQDVNTIKSGMHDSADQAVEAAKLKSKEKWIENQIMNRKKTGKTVKQIRTEAEDIQTMNRGATNAVRVAAQRRYARELGLDPDNIDRSIFERIREEHGLGVQSSEGLYVGPPKPGMNQNLPKVSAPPSVGQGMAIPGRGAALPSSTGIPQDEGIDFPFGANAPGETGPEFARVGETGQANEMSVGGGWRTTLPAPKTKAEMLARQSSAKLAANDTAELANQMEATENPLLQEILEKDPDRVGDLSSKIPTVHTVRDYFITSRRQKLLNLKGDEVVRQLQVYEREIPQIASDLGKRTDDVFQSLGTDDKLKEARWNNVIERRENPTIKPLDQAADVAYEKMRQLDQYKSQLWDGANLDADDLLLHPKPMSYDVGFWGNTDKVQEALKEKYPLLTYTSARHIANGASNLDKEAEGVLTANIAQAAGNKVWALEKFRALNMKKGVNVPENFLMNHLDLPGYKSGIEALKQDNLSFAERIAKTKLGEIEQAYANTLDPKQARELANEVIGYTTSKVTEQSVGKANQLVGRIATMRMLGSYIISNLANVNGTILEAGAGRTLASLTKILTSSEARDAARKVSSEAGTDIDLSRGMLQELQSEGEGILGKLMKGGWTKQIEVAENMMRTLNAAVGREYTQSLFSKLKLGTATKDEQNKLMRYTLSKSIDDLANQKELTEKQLKYAAYGFTEKTQGTRSQLNVSKFVGEEGMVLKTMNAFRRYTYQSTKLIKDSIVGPDLTPAERVRNATRLLLASQAMGELTGDIKAVVKGGVMDVADEFKNEPDRVNHTKKEVMERGEWLNYALKGWTGGHEIPHGLNRIIDNTIQGWMWGTVADMVLSGAGGVEDMLSLAVGPVVTDAAKIAYGAGRTAVNAVSGSDTVVPDWYKRQLVRSVPIVGPGLAGAIAPTQRESGREKTLDNYFVKDTKRAARTVGKTVNRLLR